MINIAGHPVSIFLFRFVLRKNGISYVVNESIAEDMYPEIDAMIEPLVHACSETLLRYKKHSQGDTIMDGNILTDNCFEVMLSKGLGNYFVESEKQNLFKDANTIAELLMEVMDRRTREIESGNYHGPQSIINKIGPAGGVNVGLEKLGQDKEYKEKLLHEGRQDPSVSRDRLTPEDLPDGVKAKLSYDHRGKCYAFEHADLGGLGKVILIDAGANGVQLKAEIFMNSRKNFTERSALFEDIVEIISSRM
jgi:hypothetical protein